MYYILRAIWLYMNRLERRDALQKILKIFEEILQENYSLTKVYFWAHMVHYSQAGQISKITEFKRFLMVNPCNFLKFFLFSQTSKKVIVFRQKQQKKKKIRCAGGKYDFL